MYRYDIELLLAGGETALLTSVCTIIDTDVARLRVTRRALAVLPDQLSDDPVVTPADGTWETYPIEETDPE